MVTHDRYFLDRVCNTIYELDRGQLYIYKGNYQNFLEKREERIANYNAETDKVRNILRRELEWIRSTPCARTGKARYRVNAFYDLTTHTYTDALIQPVHCKNEFAAFCDMVDRHEIQEGRKNVYIGDRGYCSYNNMAHVLEQNQFFLLHFLNIFQLFHKLNS